MNIPWGEVRCIHVANNTAVYTWDIVGPPGRPSLLCGASRPSCWLPAAHRAYDEDYLNLAGTSTGFEYRIRLPETKFRFLGYLVSDFST